jgi:hypothetical protein
LPLARLRRILESELIVRVNSSANLMLKIQAKIAARRQEFQQKNKPLPRFKPIARVPQFDGMAWPVRPISLLHKLGRMTTPRGLGNMAKLSAGWATRRYFWAIAERTNGNTQFRLSADALELDFHQKGLLSDEFGVGMAGLFMEQHFGASESMDVSLALKDELLAQQIEQSGQTQPDYLMWNSEPNPAYYLIECKGCQSGVSESVWQLRRGLEQLPSIEFDDPQRHAASYVIATCLSGSATTIYIVDPPEEEDTKRRFTGEEVSERIGERRWKIKNVAALEKRNRIAKAAQVLQWAGQNRRALATREQLEPLPEHGILPDLPTETREIAGTEYRGQILPLFPELSSRLHVFLGVDQQLLTIAEQQAEVPFELSHEMAQRSQHAAQLSATNSVFADGTCMSVEGLPA